MENVITLGKLLSVVLFPPPFYFVFDISNLYRTYKIISSNELARPLMGTIFLVSGLFYMRLGTGTLPLDL